MCLILLSPATVHFSLICKMFNAVNCEQGKPSHPVCALASSIPKHQLSPGEGQHYAPTVQVHFTTVIFHKVLDLSFCEEHPLPGRKTFAV